MKNRAHRLPANAATKNFTVRLPADAAQALLEYAGAQFGGNASAAIAALVQQALGSGSLSGLGSDDEGFNRGLKQGLHEAKTSITAALKAKWR